MNENAVTAETDAPRPSLSQRIAPHLPLLRRYARALSGSQVAGDALVTEALEALIANPGRFPDIPSPRVALYAFFEQAVALPPADAGYEPSSDGNEAVAARRLSRLTPLTRHALLLEVVEGFSLSEIALILDRSEETVSRLVSDAQASLKDQMSARILIIEDEPIIAMDLEAIVTDLGHEVTSITDTRDTAVEAALTERPDLVLADIQLADGSSGIDAVADILQAFEVPVIFVTAYPERLLTGERPEPTFLITKPFKTETIELSVSQALFFERTPTAM